MAAPFNYQIFNNVTDRETFLNNIRNVASNNGWTIDKDDITNNLELYLHSTGNGNQNLYFSMKIINFNDHTQYIRICSNTGFDTNNTWDNQPGRWYETYYHHISGYDLYSSEISFPITKQYILANSQLILVFFDIDTSSFYGSSLWKHRLILHLGIGAIDTYNGGSDTEGNYVFLYGFYRRVYGSADNLYDLYTAILGTFNTSSESSSGGLLYKDVNKYNADLGISTHKILDLTTYNISDRSNNDGYSYGMRGYKYLHAVQFNDWASRTSLIKPIVSIKHTTTEDVFFYPIGELPYYACKAYPYYKAGDIITQGTRHFMVFPILYYTNGNGVAIEVNA